MSNKENVNKETEDEVYNYLKSLTDDLNRIKEALNEFSKEDLKKSVCVAVDELDKACESTKQTISKCVKERPVETVLAAGAIGLLIGVLFSSKK